MTTPNNPNDYINWLKLAENGDKIAMNNLANCYKNVGTEKNLEKAFYWYQKAAEMKLRI
ncbi:hypothetical protein C1645_265247 [Glomus cerebriforme]|uniref:Uncharacterized protein n=1 Tax=Glomus cerebriforme TaxID=658196 RepID=A0A397SY67_9GLOM|nr:hypothetical protein C1645_265247 [Glomus cerebriforme]